ncbi:hypothetical protein [Natribacillus halophilus]|uniref:Uncharacterized protein n=1 Tax=Natribacillus halophilus TaxID=549003 RepID=A0A1G8KY03_9BACI|nr:hypothetical protein [Natribacillus halophilus]SDI48259.1 hypothetical protein SAMN04488123_102373 [Natribacillus halophilus]
MKSLVKKIKNYLTSTVFTPTIDRFIGVGFAFIGAFTGSFLSGTIPFWQMVLYFLAFCVVFIPILKFAGKQWREAKNLDKKELKPSIRAERILSNALVGLAVVLLIFTLVVNILDETFNWIWFGIILFVVLWSFLWRYINVRRLRGIFPS